MDTEGSEIISFYKGQNIFLTGATGFVGKLLIEQLLRKCEPNKMYVLIRTKKGMSPKQRFDQLFQEVVYDRLRNEKPEFYKKVELIEGDLAEENLGLNEESRMKIIENVNIVIHGGATVRFDETVKVVANINVKGTITVTKLCHQIKKLKAFVYISTAYSNCLNNEIKEEFFDPPITCDELVEMTKNLKEKESAALTPKIIGKWPNSYVFSKAIAENAILTYGKGLPVCVFRPAIIVGTNAEPLPGWIDNIYGPTGLVAGSAIGALRVIRADPKVIACVVPGDMVVCCVIAAIYKTSLMGPTMEIPIYNFASAKDNTITWKDYLYKAMEVGSTMPLEKAIWPHSVSLKPNGFIYSVYAFFLHFLPAVLVDVILIASNKSPRALHLFRKVGKLMNVLAFFATREWKVCNNNVQALWTGLNKVDKEIFNFNLSTLNWQTYFQNAIAGIRFYIMKETVDNIPRALKKRNRQIVIHNAIVAVFYGILAWVAWKCVLYLSVSLNT